jgi:hypothetical protein
MASFRTTGGYASAGEALAFGAATEIVGYPPVMRRLASVIVVLALAAGAAGASTVTSGLRGKVFSTAGGACLEGSDCGKRPLARATLVFSVAGRPVARAVTRADGSYRVHLAAGTYDVRMGQAARRVAPARASVVKGKMTTQQFVVATPHIP